MAIGVASLSSVSWVTVEKITQQVLWLALFTIMAPILGPGAYGEFSIVMVFVGFCELVLGDGMVDVLVTLVEFDERHAATSNLLGASAAGLFCLVLCALAPVVGALFNNNDIRLLMWALSPLPLFSFLSAAPIAMLQRDMQFRRLAARSTAGLALGGLVGIGVALAGGGVWALAAQVGVQRIAEVFIAWASAPLRFRFAWSRPHFRDMRPIGLHIFTARVMMYASAQAPRLLLGIVLGPVQVGLFTLASRFLDMIMFTMVFPRISVVRIELRTLPIGGRAFAQAFAAMVSNVALVSAPLLLGAAAVMPELYRIWLDPRWLPGVLPAQLLLLSGLPLALVYCFDAAFLAARLPAGFSRTSTIQAVTTTATVLIASPFGLDIVCLGLFIRSWAVLPLYAAWLRKCGIDGWAYLKMPLRVLFGAALMAAALQLPIWRPETIGPKLGFVGLVFVGALFYGAFCYAFARRELGAVLAGYFARRP